MIFFNRQFWFARQKKLDSSNFSTSSFLNCFTGRSDFYTPGIEMGSESNEYRLSATEMQQGTNS
jgi:hypothetical protein